LNACGTFFDKHTSGFNIYKSITSIDGVLQVKLDFIVVA